MAPNSVTSVRWFSYRIRMAPPQAGHSRRAGTSTRSRSGRILADILAILQLPKGNHTAAGTV
jgi:hypothetical protein